MHILEQQPLAFSPISEPEPDIPGISGTIREYVQQHPTTALLVIEISDSTAFPNLVNYSMPKDL
jgi:hypothetical protein